MLARLPFAILLLALVLGIACADTPPTATPQPTLTLVPTPALISPPTPDVAATVAAGVAATVTAQSTDTPIPTPTPQPSATPVSTSTSTPTPLPTATPSPRPVNDGNWLYFGPDCPGSQPNCAEFPTEFHFIALAAEFHMNDTSDNPPGVLVGCFPDGLAMRVTTGGPKLVGAATGGVWIGTDDDPVAEHIVPQFQGDEVVEFDKAQSITLLQAMQQAESAEQTFIVVLTHAGGAEGGRYFLDGYTANYWRLPCAE